MAKIKVFEIPHIQLGTQTVRRFTSQLTYLVDPTLASHTLIDGNWFVHMNGKWVECDEPEIVTDINELMRQEI